MAHKITSLVAFFAFLLTAITSITLYIAPQGRVAYWADWRLFGLEKTPWSNWHLNLGFLFLLALTLHVFYNWRTITAYLSRAKRLVLVTPASLTALAGVLVTAVGTLALVRLFPPFSTARPISRTAPPASTANRPSGTPKSRPSPSSPRPWV